MDNKANFKMEDLTIVLEAINDIRTEWIDLIEEYALTYMEDNPGTSYKEAQGHAFSNKEVHEAHMKLISLYGCIGSDAPAYIEALKTSRGNSNVLPFKKVA